MSFRNEIKIQMTLTLLSKWIDGFVMDFVFVETDRLATEKESKYVKGGQKPF